MVYKGNLTTLRPYQLSRCLYNAPSFVLLDTWSQEGNPYIQAYTQDRSLLNSHVTLCSTSETDHQLSKYQKTVFLDLTHFQHKLFKEVCELDDFVHSLEKDLLSVYHHLYPGEILLGNRAEESYVHEVLDHLRTKNGISVETQDNFFVIKK